MLHILYLINFLASVVALATLAWKRHWFLTAVALFCVILYGYGLVHSGVPTMDQLSYMLYCEERYDEMKAIPSVYGAMVSLIMTSGMMALFPWLKRWTLFVWFGTFIMIGIVFGVMSPLGIGEGTYGICCALMTIASHMAGMTYLQFCCIENIYVHSLLPTIFAIPAVWVSARTLIKGGTQAVPSLIISGLHLVIDALVTLTIWTHYIHLSMAEASDLCVKELQTLAHMLPCSHWMGYVIVNVMVFVVIFICDCLLSWLLYRYSKHCEESSRRMTIEV